MDQSRRSEIISPVILFAFFICLFNSSCISTKKVVYFNDLPDTISSAAPVVMTDPTPFTEPRIEPNDILAVTIQTMVQNDKTNTPTTTNSAGNFNPLNGFTVDKNGYIELSLIGFVKVGGLTTAEARELVKQKAKEFYKDPVVNLKIANFDVTVLGDVAKPGPINMTTEKVGIVDALAMAGDLSISARRDNILLIRNENNQMKFVRFDMRSKDVFKSPYYYLKQRDKIYVEPNRSRIQTSDNTFVRNLGILTSLVSLTSLILVFRTIK